MCNSSTCPYNKSGIGADFMCNCKDIRNSHRTTISINIEAIIFFDEPYVWDFVAEYFIHE